MALHALTEKKLKRNQRGSAAGTILGGGAPLSDAHGRLTKLTKGRSLDVELPALPRKDQNGRNWQTGKKSWLSLEGRRAGGTHTPFCLEKQ